MKIKNIQQYRSFYKNEIRDLPSRDENFIGNFLIDKETNKKKFGWFDIYHGDKEGYGKAEAGIENFLQSFLDMAKDGQAVYEFLQNAVDAGSTHYTMVWGKDKIDGNHYLLVANNGKMFDLNSIRSILNVGSSTKTADSQTIGKFGIGFKLAHRLVGKDNGLQELINENSGPLLFSWKNYEIKELANGNSPLPNDIITSTCNDGNISIDDENPWLFKILITCFPCLPENDLVGELPKMANGIQATKTPFSKNEYEVLSRWVKNNQSILNQETYNEGSIFFIKLGSGKESELAEINLSEGVKFALAILKETAETEAKKNKTLHTVQLNNDEPITYPDLEYIKIIIEKEVEKDTYAYIRFGVDHYSDLTSEQKNKIKEEANIEALFGFRKHNQIGDYFKGAPNMYLYFPLSEEVHNFNYILHSNAFYKGSSRTFLHKGSSNEDGINERLLKTIVKKIDNELSTLSSSIINHERQLFLNFYAALLTSTRSTNKERLWIETPYINQIDELLKKYIPVRSSLNSNDFIIATDTDNVYIKKTKVEIDTLNWGLEDIKWFYWGDDAELSIRLSAITKLEVTDFTIFNLLSINDSLSNNLNNWINDDRVKIKSILNEISTLDSEIVKNNTFKKNLFAIKFLEFHNEDIFSIDEFQSKEKEGYFIVFNKLDDIKDLLQKLGLHHTKENFDSYNFNPKYFSFFGNDSQVKSYTILTKLFSQVVTNEKLALLNKDEKHRIFEAFRTLNDNPGERMGELKLFNNNNNSSVCFKNLYSNTSHTWLNKFCIKSHEDNKAYKNYLISKEEELYQGIVFPFWEQIANYIALNPLKAKDVLDDIVLMYEKSTWPDKSKFLLSSWNQIIYQSEVIESDEIFFNKELQSLPIQTYKRVQTSSLKYYGIHIPDDYLLPYLEEHPFSFTSITIHPKIEDTITSLEQIEDLLVLSRLCNIDFFSTNCITLSEGIYNIDSSSGKKQIATSKPTIVKYIHSYYPNQYELIPDSLKVFKSKIDLIDSALVQHLISVFENDNITHEMDLIEIVLSERFDDKHDLLVKLTNIILDATWVNERQNELYVKLLKEVVETSISQDELAEIHNKIVINNQSQEINIGNIDSAHDSIEVFRGEIKIILSQSQILNLDNADNIKLIQSFHDEVRKRDLVNQTLADKLFKISNVGITDELVNKFNENLDDNKLENAHQLLFVLLSKKIENEKIKNYVIKSQDDAWYKLEGQLIIYSEENVNFIKPAYLINSSYNGLLSLLQLNDLEAFNYDVNEEDIIASRFLFIKGYNTDILESEKEINEKLDYLFKGWSNLSNQIKTKKHNLTWDNFLEIIPNQYVLNGLHTIKEILPQTFYDWFQENKKKQEFLKAIGVYVGDSPVQKLRKYLLLQTNEFPEDIEIEKFNETLLLNTLNGLAGDFISSNKEPVIYDENINSNQLSLIQKSINHIENKGVEEFPVLIYNSSSTFKILRSDEMSVYKIDETLHKKLISANENNVNLLYSKYNIIMQSLTLKESILDNTEELVFEKEFIPSDNLLEHDEPFYQNWKKEHNIKLFKQNELNYIISIEINGDLKSIGCISEGIYNIKDVTQNLLEIFYDKNYSIEDLRNEIENYDEDITKAIDELISKKNSMLTSFYNTLNSAGKDEFKSAHLEALKSAFKEENLKQERKDLIENIKTNSKYSYKWFESYLRYLLTFESRQDSTSEKSISFQEIKHYLVNNEISNKYFLLCGASSLIPLSIEDFEDFKITLVIKNHQNEKIKVEGVSKKGQDLLIYCREPISQSTINLFNEVIQIKISFSPVIDLLQRLKNAFLNRGNIDEWDDIKEALPNLEFIYGPPGTGKTTRICGKIIDQIEENYNSKYLLLTPTNKAADVLCKKLIKSKNSSKDLIDVKLLELESLGKSISITRLGKPTDPELEKLEEEIYINSLDLNRLDYTNVLASSIHRLPYFDVIDEEENESSKLFKLKDYWDYVVFDEASMINLPYLVFAILAIFKHNPNSKFIIAGDPKQIPPVVDINDKDFEELDIQDENIYTMMNISSFDEKEQVIRDGDTIENLDIQYRSLKEIGQLFSDLSYSDLLKHDREDKKGTAKILPEEFKKLVNKNVTFIDIPLDPESAILRINKLLYSPYHIYSAILVAEIIKHFDSLLDEKENWSIGLIAPYKAQAILLNKLITSYGISDKLKIYSDTVHGFQGDECDMVFFICNPNNNSYTGHPKSLLSKEYIYNVAISRARDYLIILHPFESINNNPFINKIKNSYTKNFEKPDIYKSEVFEKILFNQKNFIESNSYLTGHDNINVYGQIEMKYFIKANENAIDIQLRKFND